jgi:hypothetical protein
VLIPGLSKAEACCSRFDELISSSHGAPVIPFEWRSGVKRSKEEEIRALNEQYELLWAIVNSPESRLTSEERNDLNAKLNQLLESIKKITVA